MTEISEASAKEFEKQFLVVFKEFANLFPNNPRLSVMMKTIKTMNRADMANVLIEMDNLHLFENIETFGVFAAFITDIGLSLFKGEFSFGFDFEYKLEEDAQRDCYNIIVKMSEINKFLTEPFISAYVLKGWEQLLESETKKAFLKGAKKLKKSSEDKKSGEILLNDLITRVKTSLGPKFAVGIYNGTLTLMDGADKLKAEFENDPIQDNDNNGSSVLEALFANEDVTKKISEYGGDTIMSLINSSDSVGGKEKRMIKNRLKTKNGKRQIEATLASKLGPNAIAGLGINSAKKKTRKELRPFEHVYMSILFNKLLMKLPKTVYNQTTRLIRQNSTRFITRLSVDSEKIGKNQPIKNAKELTEISLNAAENMFTKETGRPFNSLKNIKRRDVSIYLSCLGYNKKQIDPILNSAFPVKRKAKRNKKRRRRN